jgi:SnoaL-like domain
VNEHDLRRLSDRAAIHDLLVRLALAQDANDWVTLADCFQPDATYVHPGGQLAGVDAIVDRSRTGLGPLDASQHLVGTTLVTIGEHDATAISYFQAQHVRRGVAGGDLHIVAGTYRDRLVHDDDRVWRVAHRTQEYTWRYGNREVTRRAASEPAETTA